MKTLAAALLVSTLATTAHAEGFDLSTPAFAPEVQRERLDHGQRRKVKGQVLTGIAIFSFAAGLALGVAGAVEGRRGGGMLTALLDTGAALATVAGTGLAIPGVALWVSGAREEQHARTALSASAGGLTLQF